MTEMWGTTHIYIIHVHKINSMSNIDLICMGANHLCEYFMSNDLNRVLLLMTQQIQVTILMTTTMTIRPPTMLHTMIISTFET